MSLFRLSSLKALVLIVFMVLVFQQVAIASDPVPGAEIYIEQEPTDPPGLLMAKTDRNGKLNERFNIKILKKGKRNVYAVLDRKSLNDLKKKAQKKKKMLFHFQFGYYLKSRKHIIVDKRVIIDSAKVLNANGRKVLIMTFIIKTNDLPDLTRSTGGSSKAGFAIGGFSLQ